MANKHAKAPEPNARLIRRASGDAAGACAIAIMAKASVPGLCKTRLIGPLTAMDAARLNTAFLGDMVDNIAHAAREERIIPYLAFGPAGAAPFFEAGFGPEVGLIEVALPDFGACLLETTQQLLALGHASACVLNSDSPTLPTRALVGAARRLRAPGDRAVIGPSDDGGYYLLGMKAAHVRLFQDIEWSTERVADQTRARAAEIALPLEELTIWFDVDDEASLTRLAVEIANGARQGSGAFLAHSTAAVLQHLLSPRIPA